MKRIVVMITCVLLLSGCNKELEYRGTTKHKQQKIEDQIVEKTEEMLYFDELLNSKENIGFLLSTYSSFDKIDFKELLIEFPEKYSTLLSSTTIEYNNLIKSYPELEGKEVYKMTSNNLKKYIKEKTKYALEDYEKNNLSQLIYMEAYDTYYTTSKFSTDRLIDTYKVTSDSNIYNVYYKYNNNRYKVTLKKVDNNYLFTSNIINN